MFILTEPTVSNNTVNSSSRSSTNNNNQTDKQFQVLVGDTDLDGVLSLEDLDRARDMLDNHNSPVSQEQLKALDANHDGKFTEADFEGLFNTVTQSLGISIGEGPARLEGDINGDGVRNKLDVDAALAAFFFNFNLTPGQIQRLDLNGDGRFNRRDFFVLARTLKDIKGIPDFTAPENASEEELDARFKIWQLAIVQNNRLYGPHTIEKTRQELYAAVAKFLGKNHLSGVSQRTISNVIDMNIDANGDGNFDIDDIIFVGNKDNAKKIDKMFGDLKSTAKDLITKNLSEENRKEKEQHLIDLMSRLTGEEATPEKVANLISFINTNRENNRNQGGSQPVFLTMVWRGQNPKEEAMNVVDQLGRVFISIANGTGPPKEPVGGMGKLMKALAEATGLRISDERINAVKKFLDDVKKNKLSADIDDSGNVDINDLITAYIQGL